MSQATTQESDMDDTRARAAFRLGRQYYEQGQFSEAAVEFERAYGLSGRGALLFNAYLAYREAGDDANAMRTLRGYLAEVPDAPDRAHLQARLESLQAQVTADEEHEAQIRAETEAARRDAEEARRLAEEASRPRYRTIPGDSWPWIVAGVGGAMVVAGAITGGIALGERSTLDQQCPLQLCPAGFDSQGRQSTVESLAITTDVLLIGGGVITATGIVLGLVFGLDRTEAIAPDATPGPTVDVSGGCTADGCSVSIRGEL